MCDHKTKILENIVCYKEMNPVSFQTFFTDIFLLHFFVSETRHAEWYTLIYVPLIQEIPANLAECMDFLLSLTEHIIH